MAKIAVSVLCGLCRNKKDLREGQCLRYGAGSECHAFAGIKREKKPSDLIVWAEKEMGL